VVKKIIRIFLSGIRAKLALFTGSLITLTIIVLSVTTVNQQTAILTESYEKQASISKKYISALVVELNNIARNLIQIEEFRRQIAEQQKALKVYRTAKTVTQEKKVDLGLFKTNLFGAMGTKKVRYVVDTFYSKYLNTAELTLLENRVKSEIAKSIGAPVPQPAWLELQQLARLLLTEADAKLLVKRRSALDAKIAALLVPSRKKVIEDTGLEKKLFRIETYPISDSAVHESSFDTNLLWKEGPLASLAANMQLDAALGRIMTELAALPQRDLTRETSALRYNNLELQALYSPLFQRPIATEWALEFIVDFEGVSKLKTFPAEDARIANAIAAHYPKLKDRLKVLREKKPPVPPYADAEFKNHYKAYNKLIAERDRLTEQTGVFSAQTLRNAGFEDSVLLRYNNDDSEFLKYKTNLKDRTAIAKRWSLLRKWISEAQSETAPRYLKALYSNGQIAKSRSEAEQLMWDYDASPLIKDNRADLAIIVLQENLTGVMRTLVDRTEGVALVKSNRNKVLISAILIGLISILFAVYISGIVVQKIKRIIRSAEEVGRGDLGVVFEHGGSDELGTLTTALNQMVGGLNEREKIKGILGSMIDPIVVQEAMKDLAALKRGSEKNITAFFSDIASFSAISEKLSSPDLAALLNEYLSAMTIILKEHEGVLDKYIGDAIVGIFNSPVDVEDHAYKAAVASIKMQAKLTELKKVWVSQNKYIAEARAMEFRIGLNTGLAKVGFMGTDALASYTMMGDTVNLAARLEAAGKDYGVSILASDAIHDKIKGRIFTRKLDLVRVKGKSQPVTLYQIIGVKGDETTREAEAVSRYEQGLQAYLQKSWDAAVGFLTESQKISAKPDKSAKMLIERCSAYKLAPPPANWDGVYTRTTK